VCEREDRVTRLCASGKVLLSERKKGTLHSYGVIMDPLCISPVKMSRIYTRVLSHYVLANGGDARVSDIRGGMTSRGEGEIRALSLSI